MLEDLSYIIIGVIALFTFGLLAFILKMYKKASPGEALVRTGMGQPKVSFKGLFVWPVIHRMERMDITLKTIVIERLGKEGLVCKDNLRADIKVTFFVRVNNVVEDVKNVAQSIGCARASSPQALEQLFDAKFSEALKTVGKHFDFVELYNSRAAFNQQILENIGTDLNGYVLDDCAIDYLEQTPINHLDEKNILDAEGIKKIIDLTSQEKIKANLIEKDKEKTITKQNVEARETVLELERQLAETEAKKKREIETIQYQEQAETDRVKEEEREKAERARIATEEELMVAEENKTRQVVVARKNRERTEAIETERVEKDRLLELTERERVVELARIEKEKALEEERKLIQDVIRERVMVEKAVVEEEEKIKDTKAFAEADRLKNVTLTKAEMEAQEALVKEIKAAEARKQAAEHKAEEININAEAERQASVKRAEAKKTMADAEAAETAAKGMGEAQVIEAKAAAMEKQGESEARVIELKAIAEAKGEEEHGTRDAKVIELRSAAIEKQGLAEARVSAEKFKTEAEGIHQKADAMKQLDGVGKEHEEFKLRLEKEKEIELAQINIQEAIASAQAKVIAEALKAANIDIVGGESMFFDQIIGAITKGKKVDRMVDNSETLGQIKDTFFGGSNGNGNSSSFKENLRKFIDQFGLTSEDIKNLSVANALNKMAAGAGDTEKTSIGRMLGVANIMGIADKSVDSLGLFDE